MLRARQIDKLQNTRARLQQKLNNTVAKNNWDVAKIIIKHLGITLADINKEYHYSINNWDDLLQMPGFDELNFMLEFLQPLCDNFATLDPEASQEIIHKKIIQITNLMRDLTGIMYAHGKKKFEVNLCYYDAIDDLNKFAVDFMVKDLPQKFSTLLKLNILNNFRALRDKLQVASKDLLPKPPEHVIVNTRVFHRNAVLLANMVATPDNLEEFESELEIYNKFIQTHLRDKDYYIEQEQYLFLMSVLYDFKNNRENSRYYLLALFQNAKKAFKFGHPISDGILINIHCAVVSMVRSLTKDNIFSNDKAEYILFISRTMKELISKSQASRSYARTIELRLHDPLTSQQLQDIYRDFSTVNERVKLLLWLAMDSSIASELKEILALNMIDKEESPATTSSSSTYDPENTSVDAATTKKHFTITSLDHDFLPYLYSALQEGGMSFFTVEPENTIRITNFYPDKLKEFPSILKRTYQRFINDKKIAEDTKVINVENSMVMPQENASCRETKESSLVRSTASPSRQKKEKPSKLSSKAEAIIAQNQKMPKRPEVCFTDNLKYKDNIEQKNVYVLRETKGHHIYATIDPALTRELKSKSLNMALDDLETMLDVGHVLQNSKGLRGSIISGKPFKNEKQPPGKELYVKVKNCSHDFRFFGYATHKKEVNGVNCTLLTINGWKEKHKKRSELFASIPEEFEIQQNIKPAKKSKTRRHKR